jgi:hypothetical protein
MDIQELKKRLPLPHLLIELGLFDFLPQEGLYKCPLHKEQCGESFSLSFRSGVWLWNCFGACRAGGDEISLIEKTEGLTRRAAILRFHEMLSASPQTGRFSGPFESRAKPEPEPKSVLFPSDLREGTQLELERLARLRRVDFWAVATMQQLGILSFGTVRGSLCWIVMDASRRCAEARRLDGLVFSNGAKVHTLLGSDKSWPVGVQLSAGLTRAFTRVLLVEGSGDLVAAFHWAHRFSQDCQAVAMLGAGLKRLHPAALEQLRGKSVRIVPHDDPAGRGAVEAWGAQLQSVGCTVYAFWMTKIQKGDGTRGKDLNDTTDCGPETAQKMEALFLWR